MKRGRAREAIEDEVRQLQGDEQTLDEIPAELLHIIFDNLPRADQVAVERGNRALHGVGQRFYNGERPDGKEEKYKRLIEQVFKHPITLGETAWQRIVPALRTQMEGHAANKDIKLTRLLQNDFYELMYAIGLLLTRIQNRLITKSLNELEATVDKQNPRLRIFPFKQPRNLSVSIPSLADDVIQRKYNYVRTSSGQSYSNNKTFLEFDTEEAQVEERSMLFKTGIIASTSLATVQPTKRRVAKTTMTGEPFAANLPQAWLAHVAISRRMMGTIADFKLSKIQIKMLRRTVDQPPEEGEEVMNLVLDETKIPDDIKERLNNERIMLKMTYSLCEVSALCLFDAATDLATNLEVKAWYTSIDKAIQFVSTDWHYVEFDQSTRTVSLNVSESIEVTYLPPIGYLRAHLFKEEPLQTWYLKPTGIQFGDTPRSRALAREFARPAVLLDRQPMSLAWNSILYLFYQMAVYDDKDNAVFTKEAPFALFFFLEEWLKNFYPTSSDDRQHHLLPIIHYSCVTCGRDATHIRPDGSLAYCAQHVFHLIKS